VKRDFQFFIPLAEQVLAQTNLDVSVIATCMHEGYKLGYEDCEEDKKK
jgi:hypothetical protein